MTAVSALLVACSLSNLDGLASGGGGTGDAGAKYNDGAVDVVFGGDASSDTDASSDGAYAAVVLADRPLAYLRFEELSGSEAADTSAAGNTAVLGVGAYAWGHTGVSGKAIHVDQTDIALGTAIDFSSTQAFTLEAWIYPDTFDAIARHVVIKDAYPTGGREEFGIYLCTGNADCKSGGAPSVFFERYVGGAVVRVPVRVSVAPHWSHVVGTYDGSSLSLYVQGVRQASAPETRSQAPKPGEPLVVGYKRADADGFIGYLDEVAVYDHALTPSRIAAHYAAGCSTCLP